MKIAAVSLTVAAMLAGAAAQGLGDLPNCAKSCATNAIPKNCGIDVKCICSAASFIVDVSCCIAKSCNQADTDATIKFADNLCAGQGITLPTSASCPQTAASTSSQTSASSATTVTTTASASGSSSPSSSTSPASAVSSSATSATTTGGSSSSTTAAAASAATTTGAAVPNAKTNGGVVAGLGAAAVLVAMCVA